MNKKMIPLPARIIIGFLILLPMFFGAPAKAGEPLPDPVSFRIQLELGNLDQAREWLEQGLDPNFQGDVLGSGLHIAAWNGNIRMLELFLAKGAQLNLLNKNQETPLHMASLQGRTAAAEWLIQKGAHINGEGRDRTWSPLHYAAFSGKKELVTRLLEKGADLNARSPNGTTPLMSAIYEGKRDLAEYLVRLGADRSLKNDWGDGAYEWASKYNQAELARLISSSEAFSSSYSRQRPVNRPQQRVAEVIPADLQKLLAEREQRVARGESPAQIDDAIAALRARYVRQSLAEIRVRNKPTPTLAPLFIYPTEQQKKQLERKMTDLVGF